MEQRKNKYTRIGQVLKSKDKPGQSYIVLGNKKNKDPKYNLSVEITVRNDAGEVIAKQTDGFVSVFEPREDSPEFVLFDLSLKQEA